MDTGEDLPSNGNRNYGLSGKIMMGAMVVMFFVVIVMICLHVYARWYLLRARRRRIMRRRAHLAFTMDTHNSAPPGPSAIRGLDAAVIKSLPIFVYSSRTHSEPIDCAVCLSEFVENEAGRVLPKCNHNFHIECIDMWFHSHSTCPLCRASVEAEESPESSGEVFITINQESSRNEPGSSSSLCTSSFGARKKTLKMASIDIPRRNEGFGRFENESESNTPVTQSHKSPMSRMMSLSFKRILGRERRGGLSPSGNAVISSPVAPPDVERGRDEIERRE